MEKKLDDNSILTLGASTLEGEAQERHLEVVATLRPLPREAEIVFRYQVDNGAWETLAGEAKRAHEGLRALANIRLRDAKKRVVWTAFVRKDGGVLPRGADRAEADPEFSIIVPLGEQPPVDPPPVDPPPVDPAPPTKPRTASGRILLEHGEPASGLFVVAKRIGFGGHPTELAVAPIAEDGSYGLTYGSTGRDDVELWLRTSKDEKDGREERLTRSGTGKPLPETLDLFAPSALRPPEPELTRLTKALKPLVGDDPARLAEAVEEDGRRDFTLLAESTGWDARAIAFASEAYANEKATSVPAAALYALARAGLPTSPKALSRVRKTDTRRALAEAVKAGVIAADDAKDAGDKLEQHARRQRLQATSPGMRSSPGDFLNVAKLRDADREAFAKVLTDEEEAGDLWKRAKDAGVSDEAIAKLQLQGKLAFLTLNNAELTKHLLEGIVGQDPQELIRAGYYDPEQWKVTLRKLAGSEPAHLEALVPPAIAGATLDDRVDGYAAELARRVQRMDLHAVTVAKIDHDRFEGIAPAARPGVKEFFARAVPLGFKLGQTHYSKFIKEHEAKIFAGVDPTERKRTEAELRALTSLYAVAPDDDTLDALLRDGIRSAADIVRRGRNGLDRVGSKPDGKGTSLDPFTKERITWRATQITATISSLFEKRRRLQVAVESGALSRTLDDDERIRLLDKLKGELPTLENLFGTVDFCACDECQSVLSPAAYLVDLLKLIDPRPDEWEGQKARFKDTYGVDYPANAKTPFEVLELRRPDIKRIPLTCANTNVALPYIDLANEILERAVAGEELVAYDTGDASSEDLVAEPRNISWGAYVSTGTRAALDQTFFPVSLPFDLPLEMVRAFLDALEVPLWRARERLLAPSALDASGIGNTDGLVDVWFERLGLGPLDVELLLRTNEWWRLYGYATEDEALRLAEPENVESLRNAKTLARRLDLSYEELVELLRTRFVDAGADEAAVLARLGLDIPELDTQIASGTVTAYNASVLAAAELTLDDVKDLRSQEVRRRTLRLRPPGSGCDFAKTWLAFDDTPVDLAAAWKRTFIALQAFVRLRAKLNARARQTKRAEWGVADLDRALVALIPNARAFSDAGWPASDAGWAAAVKTGLIYLAHVEALFDLAEGRVSREELLILWTDIPDAGRGSLFQRMFQGASVLGVDPVFADCAGDLFVKNRKLTGQSLAIGDHADGLRQTLALSLDDAERILVAAKVGERDLSVALLSTLFRYPVLAKVVNLPLGEMLGLLELAGKRELPKVSGTALTQLADDVAWSHTLAFVREIERIRNAGVDLAALGAICRGSSLEAATQPDPLVDALSKPASAALADQDAALHQTVAGQLGLPLAVVAWLVAEALTLEGGPLAAALRDKAKREKAVHKLRVVARAIQTFALGEAELRVLAKDAEALRPDALPLPDASLSPVELTAAYRGLLRWAGLTAAARRFKSGPRVAAVLGAAKQPIDAASPRSTRERELADALEATLGLPAASCLSAVKALGLISTTPSTFEAPDLATGEGLARFADTLGDLRRVGLPPSDVLALVRTTIDVAAAKRTRASLRSRYSTAGWRSVAKRVFDPLRAKQRDALVAYLRHAVDANGQPYGDTVEKLYEHFLLDPGMQPMVLASRIQLAIASVQTFILRVLRGQEHHANAAANPGVDPRIIDSARWEWMSRYRLWEVNRKFFIWPENWLASEFRDDKTHLFRELEGALLEGDIDEDLVRGALQKYLLGLEQIARLDMMSMYFNPQAGTLHVVGKKPNEPGTYFYRTCIYGMWTPWEPLDVGAEGEHLVLTRWRGRMHLFWVSFMETREAPQSVPMTFPAGGTADVSNAQAKRRTQVQLHWVDCVRGKWGNRGSTQGFVDLPGGLGSQKAGNDAEKRRFAVHAVSVGESPAEDLELHISHLEGLAARFVFFSKLAPPRMEPVGHQPPKPVLTPVTAMASKWVSPSGNDGQQFPLKTAFTSAITATNGNSTDSKRGEHFILERGGAYRLLLPSNASISAPDVPQPPPAVGRPSAVYFGRQDALHVLYRGAGDTLYDLWKTKNGWFWTNVSEDADPAAGENVPEAGTTDPHAYVLEDKAEVCVVTSGPTSVIEHVWSQIDADPADPNETATRWVSRTLFVAPPGKPAPGRPHGGLFAPERGAVFRHGTRLIAIRNGNAVQINLNLADAAGDPVGLVRSSASGQPDRHVCYVGADGHVHELVSSDDGRTWSAEVASKGLAAHELPGESTVLAIAVTAWQEVLVVYRGKDGELHRLVKTDDQNPMPSPDLRALRWKHQTIGVSQPPKGDPAIVVDPSSRLHIWYRSEDGRIVELRESPSAWIEAPIALEKVPTAASERAGPSALVVPGSLNVFFRSESGDLAHLFNNDVWSAPPIKVENPLADLDAGLIAPFFYESLAAGHTFFVEPFVVEKTAHQWTGYTVTTEEWVPFELPPVVPLIPDKAFTPHPRGILAATPRFERDVLPKDVVIRTSKGVLARSGGGKAAADLLAKSEVTSRSLVDTRGTRVSTTLRGGAR